MSVSMDVLEQSIAWGRTRPSEVRNLLRESKLVKPEDVESVARGLLASARWTAYQHGKETRVLFYKSGWILTIGAWIASAALVVTRGWAIMAGCLGLSVVCIGAIGLVGAVLQRRTASRVVHDILDLDRQDRA